MFYLEFKRKSVRPQGNGIKLIFMCPLVLGEKLIYMWKPQHNSPLVSVRKPAFVCWNGQYKNIRLLIWILIRNRSSECSSSPPMAPIFLAKISLFWKAWGRAYLKIKLFNILLALLSRRLTVFCQFYKTHT